MLVSTGRATVNSTFAETVVSLLDSSIGVRNLRRPNGGQRTYLLGEGNAQPSKAHPELRCGGSATSSSTVTNLTVYDIH